MRSPLLVLCLLTAATCQRVDEPPPLPAPPADAADLPPIATAAPSSPVVPQTAEPAAAPSAAPVQARCIEALVEPPPPPAKPAAHCPKDPVSAPLPLRHGKVAFPEAPGAPVVDVEIADTPESEQRGLMFRTKLGAEHGMIFVWTREAPRTFWMHNTCVPLDMLFVAKDGTVVGLLEQVPTLNDSPREVSCPAAYVLEVNAGWSRRHGVKPGMKLDLSL